MERRRDEIRRENDIPPDQPIVMCPLCGAVGSFSEGLLSPGGGHAVSLSLGDGRCVAFRACHNCHMATPFVMEE